jgi:hypothetical protein
MAVAGEGPAHPRNRTRSGRYRINWKMRSQMVILQHRLATLEAATGTGEVRSQPDETKSAGEPTAFRFKGLTLTPGGF